MRVRGRRLWPAVRQPADVRLDVRDPAATQRDDVRWAAAVADPGARPGGAAAGRMSLAQRAGQLVMVGTPAAAASSTARAAISRYHVGNVMLTGRSARGVTATAAMTSALQRPATSAATARVRLFVATDQEGGKVQVLSGPGFSRIPSATTQGSWATSDADRPGEQWGGQLRRAGVNVTLGPVADTVPASLGTANPPIGLFHRQFGQHAEPRWRTPSLGLRRGDACGRGRRCAQALSRTGAGAREHRHGVHGRDTTITGSSADLEPFRAAISAGAPFVMVSNAVYTRIDPAHPACFSPRRDHGPAARPAGLRRRGDQRRPGVGGRGPPLEPGLARRPVRGCGR